MCRGVALAVEAKRVTHLEDIRVGGNKWSTHRSERLRYGIEYYYHRFVVTLITLWIPMQAIMQPGR